jgi:hypothetical protein
MEYITASCVISDHIVYKNGKGIFENKTANAPDFLLSAYQQFDLRYPRFYKMDTLSKLGWLAAELLLRDGFDAAGYRPGETGIVLANSNGSLDTDQKYFATLQDIPSPSVFVYTLPNIMIGEISIRHKFKGENAFFISESFDAGFIQRYVRLLVQDGIVRACICGWVDLLAEDYTAALFLVEGEAMAAAKGAASDGALFTDGNMESIFRLSKMSAIR